MLSNFLWRQTRQTETPTRDVYQQYEDKCGFMINATVKQQFLLAYVSSTKSHNKS